MIRTLLISSVLLISHHWALAGLPGIQCTDNTFHRFITELKPTGDTYELTVKIRNQEGKTVETHTLGRGMNCGFDGIYAYCFKAKSGNEKIDTRVLVAANDYTFLDSASKKIAPWKTEHQWHIWSPDLIRNTQWGRGGEETGFHMIRYYTHIKGKAEKDSYCEATTR